MIPKHYNFKEIEKIIYNLWLDGNYFSPLSDRGDDVQEKNSQKKKLINKNIEKFVMVIPPPNITGRLHIGHALNNTIQDLLIRYKRMKGFNVLWIPGTDHAGIATQTVVKKMLDEEGIDYHKLGRQDFIKKVWEWKDKFGDIILDQLKSLGVSCDWKRIQYTMDKNLSIAVNHAFKKFYDQGYIYRAERIVNWCPVDRTALADDEVEVSEGGEPGFLYQIAYLLKDGDNLEELIVSTTRPETIFGDVAVAVHPDDQHYQDFVGKEVFLPLTNKTIPVIIDEYVDSNFGTGCLKITPAHDPNDFEIGKKHGLLAINIMNEDATMNENVPLAYQNLDRYACREKVLKDLEQANLLRGKLERMIPLGRSYRSKAVIEYRLSMQWFVKMKPLAKKVLARKNEINIHPKNLEKTWNYWLTNIRDWCISRQIWWGHQIPAWFNKETGEVLVEEEEPELVKMNREIWERDPDVLDTWFSSALWPMSTLGWPEKTNDFKNFFPTSALSTAKDIIFFWVARMCLMSIYFEDKMPFSDVYFHPTVLDYKGKIMSKSKGNGLDPQHIINGATVEELKTPALDARPTNIKELLDEIEKKYHNGFIGVGGDALRYTLIHLCSNMQFLQLTLDNFLELGRRFTDKLWNASRLILMTLEKEENSLNFDTTKDFPRNLEDIWMENKCQLAMQMIDQAITDFDFSRLGNTYYDLVWSDFCDWYLEVIKIRLVDPKQRKLAIYNLVVVFEKLLILLHPLIPFITEELYLSLKKIADEKKIHLRSKELLLVTNFLNKNDFDFFKNYSHINWEKDFLLIQNIVDAIRAFKKENNTKNNISIYFQAKNDICQTIEENRYKIKHLSRIGDLEKWSGENSDDYFKIVKLDFTLMINNKTGFDKQVLLDKINKEYIKLKEDLSFIEKRLNNSAFVNNVNKEILSKEKIRYKKIKESVVALEEEKAKLV